MTQFLIEEALILRYQLEVELEQDAEQAGSEQNAVAASLARRDQLLSVRG